MILNHNNHMGESRNFRSRLKLSRKGVKMSVGYWKAKQDPNLMMKQQTSPKRITRTAGYRSGERMADSPIKPPGTLVPSRIHMALNIYCMILALASSTTIGMAASAASLPFKTSFVSSMGDLYSVRRDVALLSTPLANVEQVQRDKADQLLGGQPAFEPRLSQSQAPTMHMDRRTEQQQVHSYIQVLDDLIAAPSGAEQRPSSQTDEKIPSIASTDLVEALNSNKTSGDQTTSGAPSTEPSTEPSSLSSVPTTAQPTTTSSQAPESSSQLTEVAPSSTVFQSREAPSLATTTTTTTSTTTATPTTTTEASTTTSTPDSTTIPTTTQLPVTDVNAGTSKDSTTTTAREEVTTTTAPTTTGFTTESEENVDSSTSSGERNQRVDCDQFECSNQAFSSNKTVGAPRVPGSKVNDAPLTFEESAYPTTSSPIEDSMNLRAEHRTLDSETEDVELDYVNSDMEISKDQPADLLSQRAGTTPQSFVPPTTTTITTTTSTTTTRPPTTTPTLKSTSTTSTPTTSTSTTTTLQPTTIRITERETETRVSQTFSVRSSNRQQADPSTTTSRPTTTHPNHKIIRITLPQTTMRPITTTPSPWTTTTSTTQRISTTVASRRGASVFDWRRGDPWATGSHRQPKTHSAEQPAYKPYFEEPVSDRRRRPSSSQRSTSPSSATDEIADDIEAAKLMSRYNLSTRFSRLTPTGHAGRAHQPGRQAVPLIAAKETGARARESTSRPSLMTVAQEGESMRTLEPQSSGDDLLLVPVDLTNSERAVSSRLIEKLSNQNNSSTIDQLRPNTNEPLSQEASRSPSSTSTTTTKRPEVSSTAATAPPITSTTKLPVPSSTTTSTTTTTTTSTTTSKPTMAAVRHIDLEQEEAAARQVEEVMTLIAQSVGELGDQLSDGLQAAERVARAEPRPTTPPYATSQITSKAPPVVSSTTATAKRLAELADEFEGSAEAQLARDALHNEPVIRQRGVAPPDSGPKRTTNSYSSPAKKSTIVVHDSGMWQPNPADDYNPMSELGGGSSGGEPLPGRPGIDYPIHWQVPRTSFDCRNYELSGFYADVESDCQAYHSCHKGRGGRHTFLCPNGTLFSQELLTCDWWYNVECSTSKLYLANGEPNGSF